jgi:hypothetical protein
MCIIHMKHNRSFTETHLKNQYTYFHISALLYLYLTHSVPAENVMEYVLLQQALLLTQGKLFYSLWNIFNIQYVYFSSWKSGLSHHKS